MTSPKEVQVRSLWFLVAVVWGVSLSRADERPNIVLILADDLGWSDLGCYGADLIETPHLDRLASQGVRFSNAYAMPVCSPTRAALMTGRHAARIPMTIWSEGALSGPQDRKLLQAHSLAHLPHSEITLASYLQQAGYVTALIGKWHLGDADHYPETHGFDINIGGTHWGAPNSFWWPYRGADRFGPQFRYVPDLEFGEPGEYLTDRLTDEALNIIDKAAGVQPFFLYLSHHAPHTPIQAKDEDIEFFRTRVTPDMKHQNPVYAAMVKSLDESVGRVLAKLTQRGLDQNTLVIFASDNGGYIGTDRRSGQTVPVTNNAPLRSGKGSCYEGGIRVPLIIHWPGVTVSEAVYDQPVVCMDLFATLVSAAGVEPDPAIKIDGLDLTRVLRDTSARLPRDTLYFHYPHYYPTTTPVSAIRSGRWKLLEYFEDRRVELFDLESDIAEANDLALQNPEKAVELRQRLADWRMEVDAQLPK